MPVYRGPDGKIIEEKTEEAVTKPTDFPQRPQPPAPPGEQQAGHFDAPTVKVGKSDSPRPVQDQEKTQIVGGRDRQEDKARMRERAEESDAMSDPVVGWLVVVEGPGKGRAMQLGYGMNAIGRGTTDRVKLDFGDDQISRHEHAVVTYDPRGRKFYVQHGGGTNLTYLGDVPVLTPVELPALSHIAIGNTVLRFVPLCGDGFDWQDLNESATK